MLWFFYPEATDQSLMRLFCTPVSLTWGQTNLFISLPCNLTSLLAFVLLDLLIPTSFVEIWNVCPRFYNTQFSPISIELPLNLALAMFSFSYLLFSLLWALISNSHFVFCWCFFGCCCLLYIPLPIPSLGITANTYFSWYPSKWWSSWTWIKVTVMYCWCAFCHIGCLV